MNKLATFAQSRDWCFVERMDGFIRSGQIGRLNVCPSSLSPIFCEVHSLWSHVDMFGSTLIALQTKHMLKP